MEDFVTLFKEADNAEVEGRRKREEEAAEIQEIRRVSLEAFKETKERNPDEKPKKKQRASGADAIAFIKEKIRQEGAQKENELELKKQEMELKKNGIEERWSGIRKASQTRGTENERERVGRKKQHEYGFATTTAATN